MVKPGSSKSGAGSQGSPLAREAFGEVIGRCYSRIFLLAYAVVRNKETADDLAQETFLRAWLHLESLRSPDLVEPWLGRIVRNLAWQWQRTGKTRSRLLPLIPLEEMVAEPIDDSTPDSRKAAEMKESDLQLHQAIMGLADDLRETVVLHYGDGLSISEIARLTGEAPSTVSRRLERAREQLRHYLTSEVVMPLASLRPAPASVTRMAALVSAAAALPSGSRAELLRLASDTPPAPSINADQYATAYGGRMEAAMGNSIIAKTGLAKIAAVVLIAAAAIGGGVTLVRALTDTPDRSSRTPGNISATEAPQDSELTRKTSRVSSLRPKSVNKKDRDAPIGSGGSRTRLSPQERIAALRNDLVTTNPVVTAPTDTTSGMLTLDLHVVNQSGLPVPDATVNLPEYNISFGSSTVAMLKLPEQETTFTTNQRGIARVALTQPYGDYAVTAITAQVEHPEYAMTRVPVQLTSVTRIVMEPGHRLEIIPVDAVTSAPISRGVTASFHSDSHRDWMRILKPDLLQRPDGLLEMSRIPGDEIDFHLRYEASDGRLYLSKRHNIKTPVQTAEPVTVALHPAYSVHGIIGRKVPRPITDMKVQYAFQESGGDNLVTVKEAKVTSEGTFLIPGASEGRLIYMNAYGSGYCSAPDMGSESGRHFAHQLKMGNQDQEFELEMVPTASVRVKLVDEHNKPVTNTTLQAVQKIVLGNYTFTPRISTTTDENGQALLTGVLPLKGSAGTLKVNHSQIIVDGKPRDEIDLPASTGELPDMTLTVRSRPSPSAGQKTVHLPEGAEMIYNFAAGQNFR